MKNMTTPLSRLLPSVVWIESGRPRRRWWGRRGESAKGAGLIVSPGHVVTMAHVIEGDNATVSLYDELGTRHARLLHRDDQVDVALLRLDPPTVEQRRDHPSVVFALTAAKPGEAVLAVGHPAQWPWSVTTGIVCQNPVTVRLPTGILYASFIRLTMLISHGWSGGPVVTAATGLISGLLIGKNADTDACFAIPAKEIVAHYPTLCRVERGK